MANVLYVDPLFRQLHIALTSKDKLNNQDLTNLIGKFRKKISKKWLMDISDNETWRSLSLVVHTLLKFTEYESANVRVCSYGCLGTLLLCVTPFESAKFIKAFGDAVGKIDVTPKSCIAIINIFSYLSKFVLPANFQKYIILIPITRHLNADFTNFLDYLPKSISGMKFLPTSFHKLILENILNVEKKSSISFIKSVFALVSLNKTALVPHLISLLKKSSDKQIELSINHILVTDREILENYSPEYIEYLAEISLETIEKERSKYFEFESACYTVYYILLFYNGTEKYQPLKEKIENLLKLEYPLNFNKIRFILPLSFKDLVPLETDNITSKNDRVVAICKYIKHFGDCDHDIVAKYFYELRFSRNDLYCSLIDGFAKIVNNLFRNCKENYHILLLEHIFKRNDCNWVHQLSVTNLISSFEFNLISKFIPDIFKKSISYLLNSVWSPIKKLSEAAIESISSITSYETIQMVISELFLSDWIEEPACSNKFLLLASLSSLFDSELFTVFTDISYECILLCDTVSFLTSIYKFLRNIYVSYLPKNIINFTIEYMVNTYQNFTQTQVSVPDSTFSLPIPKPTIVDPVDTDIVVNPLLDHREVLSSVLYAYEFIAKNDRFLTPDDSKVLFYLSLNLIPLFGEVAITEAIKIHKITNLEPAELYRVIYRTFVSSTSEEISAVCCKFLVQNKVIPNSDITISIERSLIEYHSSNPEYLLYCFVFVDQNDHVKAMEMLNNVQSFIDPVIGNLLMFKLMTALGQDSMEFIQDQFSLALLMFANYDIEYAVGKVRTYISSTPFYKWSINDPDLMTELANFLSKESKVVVNDLDKLSKLHWEFIFDHLSLFEVPELESYMSEHPTKFFKIKNIPKKEILHFEVNEVTLPDLSESSTSIKIKEEGKFIDSKPLIKNFLQYSNIEVDPSNIQDILNYGIEQSDSEIIRLALNYMINKKIELESSLLENDLLLELDTIHLAIRAAKIKYRAFPEFLKQKIIFYFGTTSLFEMIKMESTIYDDLLIALIESDDRFFADLSEHNFGLSLYKRLMTLFPILPFSGVDVHDLISIHINSYISYSDKKKVYILRFINNCIASLVQKKSDFEVFHIASLLYAMFENIIEYNNNSIIYEIFKLLDSIIINAPSNALYCDFIRKFVGQNGNSFINMTACTLLIAYSKSDLLFISDNVYLKRLEHCPPSIISQAILCLHHLIKNTPNKETIELVSSALPLLKEHMYDIIRSFKLSDVFSTFIITLIQNNKIFEVKPDFFKDFTSKIFSKHENPCFNTFLPTYPLLLKYDKTAIEQIKSIKNYQTNVSKILNEFFEIDKNGTFDNTTKLVLNYPNINIIEDLEKFAESLSKRDELYKKITETLNLENCNISLLFLLYDISEENKSNITTVMKNRNISF